MWRGGEIVKTIVVTNQSELDSLPERFDNYTKIEIKASVRIIVQRARGNSSVVARENSSVVARENSSVVAWENSSVEARGNSSVVARENSSVDAWGNSSVEARENSSVEARGNSSVEARENSSVDAWENSSVEARGNSSVVARGNSSVEARGNSSVVARGNSSVVARGNSSVVAWENCVVRAFSEIKIKLKQFAVAIGIGCKLIPNEQDATATCMNVPVATHDKQSFMDIYSKNIQHCDNGRMMLYKSVKDDMTDFWSGTIKYEGTVECPDWDANHERQCGGGLHLSPTKSLAQSYNCGKTLKCLVHPDDFVVYPHDITKVRCRKVEVIGEEDGT